MTRDQKRVLVSFAALFVFKAILYVSINQTAKLARKKLAEYETTTQ